MLNILLESLDKKHVFHSLYLTCTENMLNTLSVRFCTEEEKFEYRFYHVIEFKQNTKAAKAETKISTEPESNYLKSFLNSNIELPGELKLTDIKHFIVSSENTRIDIVAGGFIKEKGFSSTYCEQEKIKKLIR